jgi:hypothetical protein
MRFPALFLAFAVTSELSRAQAPVGSDDCATPAVLTGWDISVPYYNGVATTSPQGQINCPISRDLWYSWTPLLSGRYVLSTCGQTLVDTKLALFDVAALGAPCPYIGAGSPTLACNDDMAPGVKQARIVFDATVNTQYLIQLGSAGSASGGSGVLTLRSYEYAAEDNACVHDDGSSDARTASNLQNGGEGGVLQTFGRPNFAQQELHGVWLTYGSLLGITQTSLTDGTPVRVFVYDDPNEDGNPIDAQLVAVVNDVVKFHDTDVFSFVPLPAPVTLNGFYFLGWSILHPPVPQVSFAPFGYDLESCATLPGEAWMFSNGGGALDLATLANNAQPPATFATSVTWMIRPGCVQVTAESFCAGDGTLVDHTTPCPCGNNGAPGFGCAHSFSANGALMSTTGLVTNDDVTLYASNLPANSFTLFMQHANSDDRVFHDGTLCAGNPLIRLRGAAAVAGAAQFPVLTPPAGQTLSQRGGVFVGSGATRFYAAWYRNASSTFCPPATANVTNGMRILW